MINETHINIVLWLGFDMNVRILWIFGNKDNKLNNKYIYIMNLNVDSHIYTKYKVEFLF